MVAELSASASLVISSALSGSGGWETLSALACSERGIVSDEISNDNEHSSASPPQEPDAHGEAALILVESLIHGLIERSVLRAEDALDILDTAVDVNGQLAEAPTGNRAIARTSRTILEAIISSLRTYD